MLRYALPIALLLLTSTVAAQNISLDERLKELQSNPEANLTIYLDFNGHTTTDTQWNESRGTFTTPAYSAYSSNDFDTIQRIWARVAEDYAPFNVNVTAYLADEDVGVSGFEDSLLRSNSSDEVYGVRAAIGGSNRDWYTGSGGGVAYVDTFDNNSEENGPRGSNSHYGSAFVFPESLPRTEKAVAEAISHEVGHNLGLYHDGTPGGNEYYTGANGWAPIMGNSYGENAVSQWDKGEYDNAVNYFDKTAQRTLQNDLDIIADKLTYRQDDFGDGIVSGAEMLTGRHLVEDSTNSRTKSFRVEGIIGTDADVDMFQFTLDEGGDFSFSVDSAIWHDADNAANLDVLAKLYYENTDEVLWTWDPTGTMGIAEVTSLSELLGEMFVSGTYFLSLEGTGLLGAYSSYASIGTYLLSGWYTYSESPNGNPNGNSTVPEPATLAVLGLGLAGLGMITRRKRK